MNFYESALENISEQNIVYILAHSLKHFYYYWASFWLWHSDHVLPSWTWTFLFAHYVGLIHYSTFSYSQKLETF